SENSPRSRREPMMAAAAARAIHALIFAISSSLCPRTLACLFAHGESAESKGFLRPHWRSATSPIDCGPRSGERSGRGRPHDIHSALAGHSGAAASGARKLWRLVRRHGASRGASDFASAHRRTTRHDLAPVVDRGGPVGWRWALFPDRRRASYPPHAGVLDLADRLCLLRRALGDGATERRR